MLLVGDGAFGFAGMDLDTLARHGVAVVAVVGNNGVWGLEKHPKEAVYGYSVAADLRPETRYDLWSWRSAARASSCEEPARAASRRSSARWPRGGPRSST